MATLTSSDKRIKIVVNGAQGKMGKMAAQSIAAEPDLKLVAKIGRHDDLETTIKNHQADVVVDLTAPCTLFQQAQTIIENNVHPVIGTSGLTSEQIDLLKKQCKEKSLGGIIAPNFSLTAILMMRYACDAAKYFPNVEIIEMHHLEKRDAPSGTAKKTAELIEQTRHSISNYPLDQNQVGDKKNYRDVTIHSVRLPGLVAHQKVLFGGVGETLTIQQDSISRKSFMPGILLSCRKVMELDYLIYGLENFL